MPPPGTALVLPHVPALAARLWPGGGRPDGVWPAPACGDHRFLLALFALTVLVNADPSRGGLDVAGTTNRLAHERAFVPGVRPGIPTAEYLSYVRSRVTACTPLVLGTIAVLPPAALTLAGAGPPHLGVYVLLVLGAGLGTATRTVKQAAFEQKMHEFAPYLPPGWAKP